MSLPVFSTQGELFSTASLSGTLFAQSDRYRLFGKLVYPALAATRPKLAGLLLRRRLAAPPSNRSCCWA